MPRRTLKSFIKQIFNYGRGRGEQTFFYPRSFNMTNFIPLFFLIYFLIAIVLRGYSLIPLFIYFFILSTDAIFKIFHNRDIRYIFLPLTTFLLHITYGFGLIYGLFKAPFKKIKDSGLKIEHVKV